MTLPASLPLSMSQIATELGLSLPLSINHPWITRLSMKMAGGVPIPGGLPMSFSDLLGKTGRFDGAALASSNGVGVFVDLGFSPWFGGQLATFGGSFGGPAGTSTTLSFQGGGAPAPNWDGNIKVTNNTTGISVVLPKINAYSWGNGNAPTNLVRNGYTDSFTILPSN